MPLKEHIATSRAITTGLLAIASIGIARADEGGTPFWQSGQFASMAAVPDTPGWTLSVNPYYYNGSTDSIQENAKGLDHHHGHQIVFADRLPATRVCVRDHDPGRHALSRGLLG